MKKLSVKQFGPKNPVSVGLLKAGLVSMIKPYR